MEEWPELYSGAVIYTYINHMTSDICVQITLLLITNEAFKRPYSTQVLGTKLVLNVPNPAVSMSNPR